MAIRPIILLNINYHYLYLAHFYSRLQCISNMLFYSYLLIALYMYLTYIVIEKRLDHWQVLQLHIRVST